MKVTQVERRFFPVQITLETQEEVATIKAALHIISEFWEEEEEVPPSNSDREIVDKLRRKLKDISC